MLEIGPLLSPSKNKSLSFPLINDTALPYNTLYVHVKSHFGLMLKLILKVDDDV